ncbi:MAG: transporter substrate-binding domain-containing protein [bacterium]|nr:transporter substrate-binding domain-containing protein [bacterium]
MNNRMTILLTLFIFMIPCKIQAQAETPAEKVLVVGTLEAPPFSFKTNEGRWTGISIELWENIVNEMGLKYVYKERTVKGLLDGVTDESLDAVVTALTLTTEREKLFDFTHSFYNTGLGIAVEAKKGSLWKAVFKRFLSTEFLRIIGALIGGIIIVGIIIWLFERKKNKEHFGGDVKKGIGDGIWWSVVTMTTVGYGDKVPKSVVGRLIATIWIFSGVILVSVFIATITSALTVSQLEYAIDGPEDLPKVTAGTIRHTTSEVYLKENRISYIPFDTAAEGLKAIGDGAINALVYDAPLLQYFANKDYKGKIEVLPIIFSRQDYGIALPHGSAIREPINRLLLKRIHESQWQDLLYKYLGS